MEAATTFMIRLDSAPGAGAAEHGSLAPGSYEIRDGTEPRAQITVTRSGQSLTVIINYTIPAGANSTDFSLAHFATFLAEQAFFDPECDEFSVRAPATPQAGQTKAVPATSTENPESSSADASDPQSSRDPLFFQRDDWAQSQPIEIVDFVPSHAEQISALCRGEGWKTYADPEVAQVGCAAPGVTTTVAINSVTRTIAGFAQALSDGIAQGYLAQLIIHPAYRRIGIARKLVEEAYDRCGAQRLDLLTDDAQAFYETFTGHAKPGYRIYPRGD